MDPNGRGNIKLIQIATVFMSADFFPYRIKKENVFV